MDFLIAWISDHGQYAHWFIFGAILLAGANIPISADLLIVCGAILAATVVPEHALHIYLAIFLGCYFSAWIAYGLGRFAGRKLLSFKWFAKILPEERLNKIDQFYTKHGFLTLLIGRFIPFGVRNCIFMTTGISQMPFLKFAGFDLVACFIWSSLSFYVFYTLGQNYEILCQHLKTFNLLLFASFGVTLIALIWYKRRKLAALASKVSED